MLEQTQLCKLGDGHCGVQLVGAEVQEPQLWPVAASHGFDCCCTEPVVTDPQEPATLANTCNAASCLIIELF